MSKSNPYTKTRMIVGHVAAWILGGIAVLGFLAIMVGSIVHGFTVGAPWYETFGFPLTLIAVAVLFFGCAVLCMYISYWWRKKEHAWEEKDRG